ncbi:Na/Pi cotransporter family protein [Roseovarius sp. SYSU LYC5161]|uniref:Na/Pi cotransporter family protein n=1 Tax=Roseovarius halophilus (ex Wu et al. 2025) TaxID=3376060 RepID=UPI003999927B
MTILWFLVQLAGATMLLLYSVRMVRTGIERAFGASFRRNMTAAGGAGRSALVGVFMAVVLQSSAAVALLAAGFTGTGALSFGTALAVVLGGDLGSALLIQVLSFKLEWLVPVLLAVGGAFFFNTEKRRVKQAGRIVLGIAFILISLRFLRETMEPIRDSAFLPSIAGYLEQDYVTAFLAGLALAFVMHSSVAVILMCVTLVSIGAIPLMAGVSLVLGANMGSALIPIWLSRGMSPEARQVPAANFVLRGAWAICTLVLMNRVEVLPHISSAHPGQSLVNVHILFNLILLVTALPFVKLLHVPISRLLPPEPTPDKALNDTDQSLLDTAVLDNPNLALTSLKREVLRMLQIADGMFRPAMDFYEAYDRDRAEALRQRDRVLNEALDGVRHYVAAMAARENDKAVYKKARDLAEYAIAIEAAGDIVVKQLLPLAKDRSDHGIRFSRSGLDELRSLHENIQSNILLASNVLLSDDCESARLMLEAKTEITRAERSGRKAHLRRLGQGATESFESSDIHLETLRAFKDFNSKIAAISYPLLYREGQLLETRLIESLGDTPPN